ncbi:carbohydrate-binding protein [Streptomyces sp. NPDC088354]|uniref:carbohydrate-binding protein n=1 Tax=Streptomyces sp. NPDC088354 TaxID=3365856 RepID=UPI00382DC870
MTAGNNGAPEPGNDDPFGYLYRQDGEDAGQSPVAQPGVPRTSYNQVQRVGERRQQQPPAYGYPQQQQQQQQQQRPQQPGYGQQPPQQQPGYGQQPQATQAMPQPAPAGPGGGRRAAASRSTGPNSKGLLIGAVAVVAAVAIGIGVAMANGSDGDAKAGNSPSPTAAAGTGGDEPSSAASEDAGGGLPGKTDAASLPLSGGATIATDVPGAKSAGGKYVAGMETVGAAVTWKFDAPEDGAYTLFVDYTVPGADGNATITVNGSKQARPISLSNWSHAKPGDYEHAWTNSFSYIALKKGENTVALSCEAGNQCNFYLDRVWVEAGQHKG